MGGLEWGGCSHGRPLSEVMFRVTFSVTSFATPVLEAPPMEFPLAGCQAWWSHIAFRSRNHAMVFRILILCPERLTPTSLPVVSHPALTSVSGSTNAMPLLQLFKTAVVAMTSK